MDCINIFKGIKEQLDSEKRIRYCICKWTRNLPARRPCTPELTFLCRKARTLLNPVSLKSFTLPMRALYFLLCSESTSFVSLKISPFYFLHKLLIEHIVATFIDFLTPFCCC